MTVKIPRPDLAMVGLCALALVGVVVCALLNITAPPVLEFVAMTALGGGAGIAVQRSTPTADPTPAAPTPAVAPAPAVYPPAVAGAAGDPAATGVFRVVTHAP